METILVWNTATAEETDEYPPKCDVAWKVTNLEAESSSDAPDPFYSAAAVAPGASR
jgi:hypothetical protein